MPQNAATILRMQDISAFADKVVRCIYPTDDPTTPFIEDKTIVELNQKFGSSTSGTPDPDAPWDADGTGGFLQYWMDTKALAELISQHKYGWRFGIARHPAWFFPFSIQYGDDYELDEFGGYQGQPGVYAYYPNLAENPLPFQPDTGENYSTLIRFGTFAGFSKFPTFTSELHWVSGHGYFTNNNTTAPLGIIYEGVFYRCTHTVFSGPTHAAINTLPPPDNPANWEVWADTQITWNLMAKGDIWNDNRSWTGNINVHADYIAMVDSCPDIIDLYPMVELTDLVLCAPSWKSITSKNDTYNPDLSHLPTSRAVVLSGIQYLRPFEPISPVAAFLGDLNGYKLPFSDYFPPNVFPGLTFALKTDDEDFKNMRLYSDSSFVNNIPETCLTWNWKDIDSEFTDDEAKLPAIMNWPVIDFDALKSDPNAFFIYFFDNTVTRRHTYPSGSEPTNGSMNLTVTDDFGNQIKLVGNGAMTRFDDVATLEYMREVWLP